MRTKKAFTVTQIALIRRSRLMLPVKLDVAIYRFDLSFLRVKGQDGSIDLAWSPFLGFLRKIQDLSQSVI